MVNTSMMRFKQLIAGDPGSSDPPWDPGIFDASVFSPAATWL